MSRNTRLWQCAFAVCLVVAPAAAAGSGSTVDVHLPPPELSPTLPGPRSEPRPDLSIASLALESDNSLTVVIENVGTADVPPGIGTLAVYVDGHRFVSAPLADLPDQTFRTVGGSTAFDTGAVFRGQDRLVTVIVDPLNEIVEANERQNSRSTTLNAVDLTVADLEPVLLIDSMGHLTLQVRNNGSFSSPADLESVIEIDADGFLAYSAEVRLPAVAPQGSTTIDPQLQFLLATPLEARLAYPAGYDDGDTTNDRDSSVLPAPSLQHYEYLFTNPSIASHMVYEDLTATYHGYDSWPQDLKEQLNEQLVRFEQGKGGEASIPPTYQYTYYTLETARELYLRLVAQSLWVDANDIVPWKLADLPAEELEEYFGFRETFNKSGSQFYTTLVNWNPHRLHQFLMNRNLLRETRLETVYALSDYVRDHFLHVLNSNPNESAYGYSSIWPPVERKLFPVPGQNHWSSGCWGMTRTLQHVLRSVNINMQLDQTLLSNGTHATPHFVEEGLRMVHGDDMYNALYRPWLGLIPIEHFYLNQAEYDATIDTGEVDCDALEQCNTPGQQNAFNHRRRSMLTAMELLPGYFLDKLCDGPTELEDMTTGPYAKPYLEPHERSELLQRAMRRIFELGQGEMEAGCDVINDHSSSFVQLRDPQLVGFDRPPYFDGQVSTSERYEPPDQFMSFRMPAIDPENAQLAFSGAMPGNALFGTLGDVDLNGRVRPADATLVQQYIDGSALLTLAQQARADTDDDGLLTQADVIRIDQAASGGDPLNHGIFTWDSPVNGDYVGTFVGSDKSYDYSLELRIRIDPDF